MIFSNKINKIPSGSNLSLYATSSTDFDMFIFTNLSQKKNLSITQILRCINTNKTYNYNKVIKLNSNHLCVCFDNNMSIINNDEKEN